MGLEPGQRVTAPECPPRVGGPRVECTYVGHEEVPDPPQLIDGNAVVQQRFVDRVRYDDDSEATWPTGSVLPVTDEGS